MSGGTLTHGQSSYAGTISAVGTAEATTFTDRYGYVLVTNESTASPLYVTGDGSTPEATGAGTTVVVLPGQSALVANGLAIWHQSQDVIPAGTNSNTVGGITQVNPSTPQDPGFVTPMAALAGQAANPGTFIHVTQASGTAATYVLNGVG
jgi:hypothetical protein